MTPVLDQLQTWQATVVALLGAALWALPFPGRWQLWHHSIGLCLALAVGLATALVAGDVRALVDGALQGMLGLSVSWVLIETSILGLAARDAVRQRLAHRPLGRDTVGAHQETTMSHETEPHQPPDPKPGHDDDDSQSPENDGPPPHPPPPPPDLKGFREYVGRVAFAAYNQSRGGKAHDGSPTPSWEDVREDIREAWRVAAVAVVENLPAVGA